MRRQIERNLKPQSLECSDEHERIVVSHVCATTEHANPDCFTRDHLEPARHLHGKTAWYGGSDFVSFISSSKTVPFAVPSQLRAPTRKPSLDDTHSKYCATPVNVRLTC